MGLYIHIPFCVQKCRYCDFISYPHQQDRMRPYIQALKKEMALRQNEAVGHSISSIFIGGGTPTYLHEGCISEILSACFSLFSIRKDAEITLEGNPGTITRDKLVEWKDAGVNRLSLGVQACQPHHLRRLGRIHTFEDFTEGIGLARENGFYNINADLMFGLPGQRLKDWKETLEVVAQYRPQHISCYGLIVEEGTPFYEEDQKGKLDLPDEESERSMYWYGVEYLTRLGYHHYEISNFALPDHECRHNINYWRNGRYLGFGCAAHSFVGSLRLSNEADLSRYMDKVDKGESPITNRNEISRNEEIFETVMLGLRLVEGIDLLQFEERFGQSLMDIYGDLIMRFAKQGFLERTATHLRMTAEGMDVQNRILMEFLQDDGV